MKRMMQLYDAIYSENQTSRFVNEGLIGIRYRLPKYLTYFFSLYRGLEPMSVLEIGGGNGEMCELIMENNPDFIKNYTSVEYSAEGTNRMKERGIQAFKMDAQSLDFDDNSFDLVFCFDVMHHVDFPAMMADEMIRVTRRYFFLCEANGLSVPRKFAELNKQSRALNERSYTPSKYIHFFRSNKIRYIKVYPFYLFVFPKISEKLIPLTIAISEFCEKIPVLRWQGQSLLIYGEKK